MKKINLHWIPHELTPSMKSKTVQMATYLYNILLKLPPKKRNRVLTEDEIWIYYDNPRKSMWLQYGANLPTHVKHSIASKKNMNAITLSR